MIHLVKRTFNNQHYNALTSNVSLTVYFILLGSLAMQFTTLFRPLPQSTAFDPEINLDKPRIDVNSSFQENINPSLVINKYFYRFQNRLFPINEN